MLAAQRNRRETVKTRSTDPHQSTDGRGGPGPDTPTTERHPLTAQDTLLEDELDTTLILDAAPETIAELGAGWPDWAPPTIVEVDGAAATRGPQTLEDVPTRLNAAPQTGTTPAPRLTVLPSADQRATQPTLVYDGRPRYEPQGLLGEGGMGSVYRAQDNDIGRPVAVKSLHPHLRSGQGVVRFTEEIRTIGRLEHPNIVPIHDVGVDEDGGHYFVMRYLAGETLASIIERLDAGDSATHERYGFERRVEIFIGVLEALHHAHAMGIIHRDLKPANIMVGPHGEVVVMDWGLAKTLRHGGGAQRPDPQPGAPAPAYAGSPFDQTVQGAILGTPAYMSPEQARGEDVDERSDTYSACVLLWELLCLRHYLRDLRTVPAVIAAVIQEPVPLAMGQRHPHQPRVPASLGWFLQKGLAKDRSERFQSVEEMLDRLRLRSEGVVPIQCPITFSHRVGRALLRQMDRHPLAFTLAMGVAVIGAGLLGLRALL